MNDPGQNSAEVTDAVGLAEDVAGYKRTQDQLHESERRFRAMLDNLQLIALMLDLGLRITYCNDYFLRLTGWERQDVIGQDWSELFIAPEQRGAFREAFASMLLNNTEALSHRANEILTRTGERRLVRWNNSVLLSISGEVAGTASIGEDITNTTLAERELGRSEEQLRIIVDASTDGVWEFDAKTGEGYWSDRAYSMLGYTRAMLHPGYETFRALVHPDDFPTFRKAMADHLELGKPYRERLRIRHANGSYIPILTRGQVQKETSRVVGVFTDLSIAERTEDVLREQAALLANAQRMGQMGSWSLDLGSGRLIWPDATCYLFGISPSEFNGTFEQFRGLILAEDLAAYDAANASPSPLDPSFEAEYRIRRPDGRVRWMYSRGNVEFDASGTALGCIGMVMDITEQQADREQLARNAALLRTAGRAARLGGWTIELPGRDLTWSDEVCDIHDVSPGYKPNLDEGIQYYPTEYQALVKQHLEECEQRGIPYDFELPKMTAKGRRIWVRSMGEAVRDADGKIIRLQGAFQDISDRKNAELQLRESEERYRMLFDRNPHPTWVYDIGTRRFLAVNEAAVQHYGFSRDEFLEMTLEDIGPPEQVSEMLRLVQEEGESAAPQAYRVSQHRKKDGTLIDVEIASSQITFGGQQAGLILANDVTERRRIELVALRKHRLESLGTLAGGIAHDMNNLLLPIRMGVTLLKCSEQSESSLRVLDNIDRSVKRGTDLVKQVLLFARGVEGSRAGMDLTRIIDEVAAIVASSFPKNISFSAIASEGVSAVWGDETQLSQVLLNLCVNARDAMQDGGTITVSVGDTDVGAQDAVVRSGTPAGRYVLLEIADNGSGMTKEVLDHIFEPFFTTKDLSKGTGLGLSTALGIVRSHGGFIDISSKPGKGSTFRVFLPAYTEAATNVEESETGQVYHGNGDLILVVDDEVSILDITRQTLETFGYAVLTAENGAQAIEIYEHDPQTIKAVLTDLMMPVMDGATLIEALRRINPDVPIIAVSGQDEPEQRTAATNFLCKPYSAEVLLRTLAMALDGSAIQERRFRG